MLRSCYSTKVHFSRGSNQVSSIKWYWCEPGAETLPFPTPFASRNYVEKGVWPDLGEVEGAARSWRNGSFPIVVPGTSGPCGAEEVWRNGYTGVIPPIFPRDVWGLLPCCHTVGAIYVPPLRPVVTDGPGGLAGAISRTFGVQVSSRLMMRPVVPVVRSVVGQVAPVRSSGVLLVKPRLPGRPAAVGAGQLVAAQVVVGGGGVQVRTSMLVSGPARPVDSLAGGVALGVGGSGRAGVGWEKVLPAIATPVITQSVGAKQGGGSLIFTFSPSVSNVLLTAGICTGVGASVSTPTGWTLAAVLTDGTQSLNVFWRYESSSVSSVTFTCSPSTGTVRGGCVVISGLAFNALDVSVSASGAGSPISAGTTPSTSVGGEVGIQWTGCIATLAISSYTNGYAVVPVTITGTSPIGELETSCGGKVLTSAGVTSTSGTLTTAGTWVSWLGCFK